jgi:hypothetical protein
LAETPIFKAAHHPLKFEFSGIQHPKIPKLVSPELSTLWHVEVFPMLFHPNQKVSKFELNSVLYQQFNL